MMRTKVIAQLSSITQFGPRMNGRGQGVIVLPEGFPYCRLLNSHFLQMVLVFPLLKHPEKRDTTKNLNLKNECKKLPNLSC